MAGLHWKTRFYVLGLFASAALGKDPVPLPSPPNTPTSSPGIPGDPHIDPCLTAQCAPRAALDSNCRDISDVQCVCTSPTFARSLQVCAETTCGLWDSRSIAQSLVAIYDNVCGASAASSAFTSLFPSTSSGTAGASTRDTTSSAPSAPAPSGTETETRSGKATTSDPGSRTDTPGTPALSTGAVPTTVATSSGAAPASATAPQSKPGAGQSSQTTDRTAGQSALGSVPSANTGTTVTVTDGGPLRSGSALNPTSKNGAGARTTGPARVGEGIAWTGVALILGGALGFGPV